MQSGQRARHSWRTVAPKDVVSREKVIVQVLPDIMLARSVFLERSSQRRFPPATIGPTAISDCSRKGGDCQYDGTRHRKQVHVIKMPQRCGKLQVNFSRSVFRFRGFSCAVEQPNAQQASPGTGALPLTEKIGESPLRHRGCLPYKGKQSSFFRAGAARWPALLLE
jgi:hypothetical protein